MCAELENDLTIVMKKYLGTSYQNREYMRDTANMLHVSNTAKELIDKVAFKLFTQTVQPLNEADLNSISA